MSLERALSDSLVRFLTREVRSYQRRIPNNLENLKKHIRPGDVLLVEGKSRVAQIIKYVTQSSWSHSTIYVGEHAVREGGPHGERFRELYGEEARHLVIEADLEHGVFPVPLAKYVDYNVRVCRPYCLTDEDRDRVVDEVVSHIGDQYDRRQLVDLGRYLTPFHLLPGRWRRKAFFSGQSDSRSVICSSLIAQAFLGVRYPILPVLPGSVGRREGRRALPLGHAHPQPTSAARPPPGLRPLAVLPHREVQLRRGRAVRIPAAGMVGPDRDRARSQGTQVIRNAARSDVIGRGVSDLQRLPRFERLLGLGSEPPIRLDRVQRTRSRPRSSRPGLGNGRSAGTRRRPARGLRRGSSPWKRMVVGQGPDVVRGVGAQGHLDDTKWARIGSRSGHSRAHGCGAADAQAAAGQDADGRAAADQDAAGRRDGDASGSHTHRGRGGRAARAPAPSSMGPTSWSTRSSSWSWSRRSRSSAAVPWAPSAAAASRRWVRAVVSGARSPP